MDTFNDWFYQLDWKLMALVFIAIKINQIALSLNSIYAMMHRKFKREEGLD